MCIRASPRWGLAFAVAYAASMLALGRWLGRVLPFHLVDLFLVGVGLAAYFFAWWPALLLFLASVSISWALEPPEVSLRVREPADLLPLGVYAAANLIVIVGFHRLQTAVAALRRTEESHRLLVESAGDGIVVFDRHLQFVEANPRAQEILGYRREELLGRKLRDFAVHGSPEALPIALPDVFRGATSLRERAMRRSDGALFTAEVSARLLRDGRILAILRDVSERKRMEEALIQSEGRFRRFSEATAEGIVIHEDGVILDANPALAALLGYAVSEMVERQVWEFVAPESRDAVREHILAGGEQPYEAVALHRDGTALPVEVHARMIPYEGRRVRVTALRDLRERKRMEERLREAQKMEAIGRLAGGVAHDFNNLLTVVTGYAHLLCRQLAEGSELRGYTDEVINAAQRAAGLANQLLAFSRRQLTQPRVIDLNALLAELQSLLRRVIGEHIELRTELAPRLATVKADPTQLEQVVMNLVLNARDAMPGGGLLSIRTANQELRSEADGSGLRPGEYVLLEVSDTGHGMDAETRSHIFEPFFTTKDTGAGLGLATTYGIVKQHGGDIRVTSVPDRGTTFEILLPRAQEEPAVPAAAEPAQPPPGAETILLVEDEKAVGRMVGTILRERGYTVLLAAGPAEALDVAAHSGHIDLLLSDVIMPGMSGGQLARQLAAVRPGLKVLFISGYTDCMLDNAGAEPPALLQKPFTPDALARKVREVLEKRAV